MQKLGKDYSKVKHVGQGCQGRVKEHNNLRQRKKKLYAF